MKRRTALFVLLPLLFLRSGLWPQNANQMKLQNLARAVSDGDLAAARVLLAAGTDVNEPTYSWGRDPRETFLMEAAFRGKADMLALLLDSGASLDAVDSRGMTALSYAASSPDGAEAAFFLIGKGARSDVPVFDARKAKTSVLKAAAINGMLTVVDALAPNSGNEGKTQLSEAMRYVGAQGKTDLVEALLSRGVAPLWDDLDRSDALVRAAGSGYLDVVMVIIKRGARADSPDAYAKTPLQAAAEKGRIEVLRYLLDKGAMPLARDRSGRNALEIARAYRSNPENDPTIPLIAQDPYERSSALAALLTKAAAPFDLFCAINSGDLSNVKKLAKSDTVNLRDTTDPRAREYWSQDQWAQAQGRNAGPSPLFLAVETGRLDIVKAVAENGALIDDPCTFCGKYEFYSMTPLEEAVRGGKEAIAGYLLGRGAKPSADMLADACMSQSLGIVKLLAEKGADVNAVWPGDIYVSDEYGDEGWTRVGDILSAAVQGGAAPVVDYLRKKGAKLSRYVLAAALIQGNASIAHDCLAAGIKADANELVLACGLPDKAIVRELLGAGVDPNGMDARGRTPLTVAAERGDLALVKLLLENGADVGKQDKRGNSALSLVEGKIENGAWEIANFLRQTPPGPKMFKTRGELSKAILKKDGAALKRLLDAKADPRMLFLPPDGSDLSRYPPSLLDVACVTESKETIQLLISRGAGLDDVDKGLAYIAADGRLDLVELLLSSKTGQPDFFRARLNELLCIAGKTGNAQLAALALAKGADPNIETYGNPLRTALEHGSMQVAELLLARGADIDKPGISDYAVSRLIEALIGAGKWDTARPLLDRAGSQRRYLEKDTTMLGAAIQSGDRVRFDWLLKNGVDANLADYKGDTPLHAAVDSGDLSIVQALIEKGASPEAFDARGETAAMRAAALADRLPFLEFFLKRGNKAGLPGLKGFTLIDAVMVYGSWNEEILGLLADSYAAFPATDPALDARQRLFLALMKGDSAKASSILEERTGLADLAPFRGRTALMGCAAKGEIESLKCLLGKGANAAIRDGAGLTALSEASRSGKRPAIDLLLPRMPASPDPREEALRQAAYSGSAELVASFLAEGVDPDAVQDGGASALYLAAWRGKTEIIDLLLKAAAAKGAKTELDRKCVLSGGSKEALTPAEAALASGRFETAEYLLGKGAKVDWLKAASQPGASVNGRLLRLFASRAGAEDRKKSGSGILALAAYYRDKEGIKLLMAAGIDPTDALNTSLGQDLSTLDEDVLVLLAAKSKPMRLYSNVMELAIEGGKGKFLKALLDAGCDPKAKAGRTWWDEEGPSFFRLAAFQGYPGIMRSLIAKGATDALNPPELAFLKYVEK